MIKFICMPPYRDQYEYFIVYLYGVRSLTFEKIFPFEDLICKNVICNLTNDIMLVLYHHVGMVFYVVGWQELLTLSFEIFFVNKFISILYGSGIFLNINSRVLLNLSKIVYSKI